MKHSPLILIVIVSTLLTSPSRAQGQGTAFTYQGRLNHGGGAASGLYEMSFALYDAATNGNLVGAPGFAGWSSTSDRNTKDRVSPVNPRDVLEKVCGLAVSEWSYRDCERRHIGPMAQDFHAAFGLGAHETAIATVDADGVALAAIQELNKKMEEWNHLLQADSAGRPPNSSRSSSRWPHRRDLSRRSRLRTLLQPSNPL